ncbi:flagellin, putative [Novosphingobium sp. Rr 2-17]|uniref:flagellin n=1 Tax=Novosphingobium sp. Rr 2-17 TaxID=555793 RepID=UPI000269954C|nr:flagellin [Novosphingobium sp. Rr 2-17]EIZ78743.1 flagellin, putative [Novosphingobium sp. Rr 2-17]
MSRVATIPLQRTMSAAIQHSQQLLATTQARLATGKKAPDYASLGVQAVRNLSTHSLRAQQESYVAAATQVGTTLTLNDTNMSAIDSSAMSLKQDLLNAIGSGQSPGLNEAITAAFNQFRAALNASDGGRSLFGGSQTDAPAFLPDTLADTVSTPASAAFANDGIKASARLSDQVDIQYGVTASEIGSGLYSAFQTLAGAGSIGNPPTASQIATLSTAAGQIDAGLSSLRAVSAENGRKQAQTDTLSTRASDRSDMLQGIIADNEDADLGQVAIDLAQQKAMLEASYSVFSQLSGLSLAKYLG